MQYSPKLKVAMEEIKSILKKNDVAGLVVLHTPGFSEYLLNIDPSYSIAWIENGKGLRVKTNPQDPPEIKKQKVTDTANMFEHLSRVGGMQVMHLIDMNMLLQTKLDVKHGPGSHTGHSEQNS